MKLFLLVLLSTFLLANAEQFRLFADNDVSLLITSSPESDLTVAALTLNDEQVMLATIGSGRSLDFTNCNLPDDCSIQSGNVTLTISKVDSGFSFSWASSDLETVFIDCLQLNPSELHWFGGPEKWTQDFPIETSKFVNRPYTSIKTDNGAVSERYWLNSKGGYVYLNEKVPLFLDQNNQQQNTICFTAKLEDPYVRRDEVILEYVLVAKENAKEAQLHAVNNYLGKASEHPDEWIIRNPIWTTWAKYKRDINDSVVVDFATEISSRGYSGQIEIDDYWETCYGTLTFNDDQFPNINETVQTIKDLNFTVSLWTHPFVNHACTDLMAYAEEQGYFVTSVDGTDVTSWWDGNPAHYIDFTNKDAAAWFVDRLKLLQDLHGITSFKFDAGEADYPPFDPVLSSGDVELSPGLITTEYIKTVASFGGLIEVRSAYRNQDLPIFLRMLDKDSSWSNNNGLASLITTLLTFNLVGYSYVLPDMIGGNGYSNLPTAELIARWIQANTFMPTMQFSYMPWDITSDDFDGEAIMKKYVDLHTEYADEILAAMDNYIATGAPVNPPVWWVDPTDAASFAINDQFLLGENILVAPVIIEGAVTRDVYIPTGTWKDGNNDDIYEGPQTIKSYSAPIDVLPYFIKQTE